MPAKTKLVRERRFPVKIDEEGRHIEDTPNGTLVEFTWRFGPKRSPNTPEQLTQDLTIAVYSHGQIIEKYATAVWRFTRDANGRDEYDGMNILFNPKEKSIDLSLSNYLYRMTFPGRYKIKRFGKNKATYPGTAVIQKFEIT